MKKKDDIKVQDKALEQITDKRSEEVADIIDRMPTGWTRLVVAIIMVIVVTMVTLGCIIKYPDTVTGQISITGEVAPVRLISSALGRLHLLVENNTEVKKGTCLGYIESGAVYEDILRLDSLCNVMPDSDTQIVFPDNLELGVLSAYYNDFVLSYIKFNQLRETKVYDNMRRTLRNQQLSNSHVSENLKREIDLNSEVLANMHRQYASDSILHKLGAISDEVLSQQYNSLLSCKRSDIELKSTELIKQSEIKSIDIELAKVDVTVREEMVSTYNTMLAKFNVLVNQIRQWKEQYLFISPINGLLQYQSFWRDNVFLSSTTEVFSISPAKNRMIGELLIPASGAGKVKVGQDVNVKLTDYPSNEYGYIRGKVEMLSSLTHNMQTPEGNVKAYLVTVSFPDGIKTNFGKQLRLNFESAGTGEIITAKRRLIHRLFDNLKAKETK
ncbi:MAG: HlyD family secretion protein [Bacteroidaceae bacterium]|nr:HlyD family secretion protein [Bacteroidaceae bacterium]